MLKKFEYQGSCTIFVQEPCFRTVIFSEDPEYYVEKYFLPFPYVIFVSDKDNVSLSVAFTIEFPTLESKIYVPSLSNIFLYDDKIPCIKVCLENLVDSKNILDMISYFWQSPFEIDGWFGAYLLLSEWEKKDLSDVLKPDAWKTYQFMTGDDYLTTVSDLINHT